MTDEERQADAIRRYDTAAHSMQSATALQITRLGDKGAAADPKNLRVGVNSAMVDSASLAELLIGKGVITHTEYLEAIARGMEREAETRAQETRRKCGLGDNITFG